MTSRERWTIYPLLFLAIGIALRDQFPSSGTRQIGRLEANEIICNELYVREQLSTDIKFDKLLVDRIYTLDKRGKYVVLFDGGAKRVPFVLQGAQELFRLDSDDEPKSDKGDGKKREVEQAEEERNQ